MKIVLPFLMLLTGCGFVAKPLQKQKADNNKTYEVVYLFEHDGCKVYRFLDIGGYVYFTKCNGETIAKKDSSEVRNIIRRN